MLLPSADLRLVEVMRRWDTHCMDCRECDRFAGKGNGPPKDSRPCDYGREIIKQLLSFLAGVAAA
jgi:hypothetical protein